MNSEESCTSAIEAIPLLETNETARKIYQSYSESGGEKDITSREPLSAECWGVVAGESAFAVLSEASSPNSCTSTSHGANLRSWSPCSVPWLLCCQPLGKGGESPGQAASLLR